MNVALWIIAGLLAVAFAYRSQEAEGTSCLDEIGAEVFDPLSAGQGGDLLLADGQLAEAASREPIPVNQRGE